MAKLSLQELASGKLSKKLITVANSIKGGNESSCHPDSMLPSEATTIIFEEH